METGEGGEEQQGGKVAGGPKNISVTKMPTILLSNAAQYRAMLGNAASYRVMLCDAA